MTSREIVPKRKGMRMTLCIRSDMVERMACSFAVVRVVFIVILYSSSNWYTEAETGKSN